MSATPTKDVSAALEKIIRPIMEGQIKGFLKEHPVIVNAVDWYPARSDKAITFTNSLSKRIVRDLTCGTNSARLVVALLECMADEPPALAVACSTAAEPASLGSASERGGAAPWMFSEAPATSPSCGLRLVSWGNQRED